MRWRVAVCSLFPLILILAFLFRAELFQFFGTMTDPKIDCQCRDKTPAELPVLSLGLTLGESARHTNAAARDVGEHGASGTCAMTDSRVG
jgi:hypothetical protein